MIGKKSIIKQSLGEHLALLNKINSSDLTSIIMIANVIVEALSSRNTIFWCGNGGSASDGQHLAAELVGRFKSNRRPLSSVALNTDTSVLTCIANDFSYNDIFSRQIDALGKKGDVLIGLSTSGNSPNIIKAFKHARQAEIKVVGLLGKGGGEAVAQTDLNYIVESDSTARIQEVHIMIGHILCELIEDGLGLA